MLRKQTVLVLGAGASKPYGFPTGAELRKRILALSPTVADEMGVSAAELHTFLARFRLSERASIDSFLGQNQELANAGKAAIAKVLLESERSCHSKQVMHDDDNQEHWYRDLFEALTEHVSFASLDFSLLKIVTFNYDRSLEHYLFSALKHAYWAVSEEQVLKKLATLEVAHVYGSLSAPLPRESHPPYLPFGGEVNRSAITMARGCIEVLPEGRDDAEGFLKARDWLREAQTVGILGFAFDPLNLQRLGAPHTLSNRYSREGEGRAVRATCYKMTEAQARRAARTCGIGPYLDTGLPAGFWDADCRQMLRETLLLSA